MDRFASNLKALRIRRGLLQTDMQDKLSFSQARWSSWEKGKAEPSLADLQKIADFFNVSETDILRKDLSSEYMMPDKIETRVISNVRIPMSTPGPGSSLEVKRLILKLEQELSTLKNFLEV